MKTRLLQHELSQTSGIFGRKSNVRVVFQGNEARTDGNTIQLPAMPPDAEISEEGAMVVRGYLDHEAGHVRHTEMEKSSKAFKEWGRKGEQVKRRLANAIEDVWLERRVRSEYPGSIKNLRAVSEAVNNRFLERVKDGDIEKEQLEDPAKMVALAITWEGRKDYGGDTYEECLSVIPDTMRKQVEGWVEKIADSESTTDNMELAEKIWEAIGKPMEDPEEEDEEGNPAESDASRLIRQNSEPDIFDPEQARHDQITLYGGELFDEDASGLYRPMTTRFDHFHHPRLETRWQDRMKHTAEKAADYDHRLAQMTGPVNVIRRRLERAIMAQLNRDWDFAKMHGRIDSRRFPSVIAGRENVFKMRSDLPEMDTAMSVLVDLSGSMSGLKMSVARDCAMALAEAVDRTGIKYEIVGFSNRNTFETREDHELYARLVQDAGELARSKDIYFARVSPLHMPIFKAFEDRLHEMKGLMVHMDSFCGGDNSDGEAVDYVVQRLRKRPEKRKILMVLSDGEPISSGYSPPGVDAHGLHLKATIDSVIKMGIDCIGIGICDRNVERFYPDHVVVDNLDELAGEAIDKIAERLVGRKVSNVQVA